MWLVCDPKLFIAMREMFTEGIRLFFPEFVGLQYIFIGIRRTYICKICVSFFSSSSFFFLKYRWGIVTPKIPQKHTYVDIGIYNVCMSIVYIFEKLIIIKSPCDLPYH